MSAQRHTHRTARRRRDVASECSLRVAAPTVDAAAFDARTADVAARSDLHDARWQSADARRMLDRSCERWTPDLPRIS
jgi:hypothetical protein